MALFQYKARGTRGDAVEGTIEAASADAAASRLMEGGLTPVDIGPAKAKNDAGGELQRLFPQRVGTPDLIQFSRQMHSLTRAGVPLLSALTGLAGTTRNRTLAQTLSEVAESLGEGHDLATALSRHPKVFSLFYVSLVRVGETSGRLQEVFQQLAFYLEREKTTRDQVRSALRYPLFVLTAIAVAMVVINAFVVPAFAGVYGHFGARLPVPTRILVAISDFTVQHWVLLVMVLAGTVVGARFYVQSDEGRYRWDKLKLRLPLVGPVIYQATLARFTRLFAMAQSAGVPLITGLSVVARALDNRYVEERILGMRAGVERGESLGHTAAGSGIFDHLVLQMIAVGEESGTIDELLNEVADYYDREVDYTVAKLSAAIEPILTVVIGLMVLVLALGVFLPMWDLAQATLHHG
ncbi:MAG TPA: type II secretion system F family protein [Gammaproteobacteria bacterium]|nr:type II secretion system F family protein [Gammaproteobacteria bacterium]